MTTKHRDVYRQYQMGQLTEEEAREIIGDDWNVVATGVMMKDDMDGTDWSERYSDEYTLD